MTHQRELPCRSSKIDQTNQRRRTALHVSFLEGLSILFLLFYAGCVSAKEITYEELLGFYDARGRPSRVSLFVEARSTEIFHEPIYLPGVGPPPDNSYLASVGLTVNDNNAFKLETEYRDFDKDDEEEDSTHLRGRWDHILATGTTVRIGGDIWTDEGGDNGWSTWVGAAKRIGWNIDAGVRIELIHTSADSWAGRVEVQLDSALSAKTALRLRGWSYRDEDDLSAFCTELNLAQAVVYSPDEFVTLHVMGRYYENSEDEWSNVRAVHIKVLAFSSTVMSAGYRWYEDSAGVRGDGPTIGIAHDFTPTFGVDLSYRRYWTNENMGSDTYVASAVWKF